MTTSAEKSAPPLVLRLERTIVLENRQELKDQILTAFLAGARRIVLDLSGTEYIDSSGCGVLVSVSKQLRDRGGELVLAGLTGDVQLLFTLTKLDQLFTIAESVDAALASYGEPPA